MMILNTGGESEIYFLFVILHVHSKQNHPNLATLPMTLALVECVSNSIFINKTKKNMVCTHAPLPTALITFVNIVGWEAASCSSGTISRRLCWRGDPPSRETSVRSGGPRKVGTNVSRTGC